MISTIAELLSKVPKTQLRMFVVILSICFTVGAGGYASIKKELEDAYVKINEDIEENKKDIKSIHDIINQQAIEFGKTQEKLSLYINQNQKIIDHVINTGLNNEKSL